ncbi:uncharacterized protein LOC116738544 [Nasonia vitripennis]|uniref:Uncharacterized protein n=1 Tax=Nasonia vitripennis TaxID=7425 RepID=A0A7M7TCT7_NASVI|nr:uncharacterized protein LOC116738544 [Nasonia vitripennis]
MPSPSLMEMCSRSFTSIHNQIQRSVHQIIHSYTKTEVETSPYLSSIQSLTGSTPGKKLKSLNSIIHKLAENARTRGDLTSAINDFQGVSPVMLAFIRVAVAVALELKLDGPILEGLKSPSIRVVKRALKADWFFAGSNVRVNAEYFVENVMPFVSLRTRSGVIRKLAIGLKGYPKKAEAFFDRFAELYGTQASLPILNACSEAFIYDRILRHKIVLPLKSVHALYERCPELVIRYLQLGNPRNENNAEDRKVLEIRINDYDTILPKLVRKHPVVFAQLYELTPEKGLNLSSIRTSIFLKSLKNVLMEKPRVFLKILSLKVVSKSLKKEEFDRMYENLFPRDMSEANVKELLDFAEYYPHGNKLELLRNTYEKVYGKDLLNNEAFTTVPKFWKLLPVREREIVARRCFEMNQENKSDCLFYLPPRESLPLLREEIASANEAEERFEFIGQMIDSCSLYESKRDLLDVLTYYYERHRNERDLYILFEKLEEGFDLKSLDVEHWFVVQKIIYHAHARGELFRSHVSLMKSVLEAVLYHLLVVRREQDDDETFVNKLFELTVKCNFEKSVPTWNILKERPDVEKSCLEQFLQMIPDCYPTTHDFWSDKDNRLYVVLSLVKSVHSYNSRLKGNQTSNRIKIEDYPWLTKMTDEFFSRACGPSFRKSLLLHLLRVEAPDFFYAKIDECSTILDIDDLGEALRLLKHDLKRILASWPDYLTEARDKLCSEKKRERRAARMFISASRWCHELPTKFVERCLLEIEEKGSIQVLGLLFEGEVFEKLVAPYLPREASETEGRNFKRSFETSRAIALAARYPEPPVSLSFASTLTRSHECSPEIGGTVDSLSRRYPVKDVLGLAEELLEGRSVAARKFGVRLLFQCLRRDQQTSFAEMLCKTETNSSVGEVIAESILEMFSKSPSEDNWKLVKDCINRLSAKSRLLEKFADLEKINVDPRFLGRYVEAYLDKVESLYREDSYSQLRTKCVSLVIMSLNLKSTDRLDEEVSSKILNRYFLDAHSLEISQAAQSFAVGSYLLSSTKEKFRARLKVITAILKKIAERLDASHPKKPRFYPSNYTLMNFYSHALTEIAARRPNESLEMVDKMLEVFDGELSPWQVPTAYLAYNLYKEYLLAENPKDFGTRCRKRITGLIEDLSGSDVMIKDVAECLDSFLTEGKIYPEVIRHELRQNLIDGLLEGDDHYGLLVAMLLVRSDEVDDYDGRYDAMVKKIGVKKNKPLQYFLYKHLNGIQLNSL